MQLYFIDIEWRKKQLKANKVTILSNEFLEFLV